GVGLARALEPRAREPVPERAILVRQHAVRRFPHQRVPEGVLRLPAERRLREARDELALLEISEDRVELPRRCSAAEQLIEPAPPEHLPEDAGGPQRAARRRAEVGEPRL